MLGALLGIGLVWAIIEIAVWIGIAQFMSGWWVFLWFIAAFFIGGSLLKTGMKNISPMAQQMRQGGVIQPHLRPPDSVMTKSMALVVAGILLMIPGVLSDLVAVFMLLPPVQNKLKDFADNYMRKNQQKMMEMMQQRMQDMGMDASQFGGQFGGGQFGGGAFGGGQNPFENTTAQKNQSKSNSKYGGFGQTVDGSAKVIKNDKKITHAANDE